MSFMNRPGAAADTASAKIGSTPTLIDAGRGGSDWTSSTLCVSGGSLSEEISARGDNKILVSVVNEAA